MGKSTVSMAIFNSYVSSPEGKSAHVSYDGFHKHSMMVSYCSFDFWPRLRSLKSTKFRLRGAVASSTEKYILKQVWAPV
jgi:hypothetical protein